VQVRWIGHAKLPRSIQGWLGGLAVVNAWGYVDRAEGRALSENQCRTDGPDVLFLHCRDSVMLSLCDKCDLVVSSIPGSHGCLLDHLQTTGDSGPVARGHRCCSEGDGWICSTACHI